METPVRAGISRSRCADVANPGELPVDALKVDSEAALKAIEA